MRAATKVALAVDAAPAIYRELGRPGSLPQLQSVARDVPFRSQPWIGHRDRQPRRVCDDPGHPQIGAEATRHGPQPELQFIPTVAPDDHAKAG
jgi:hypothetical protein